MKINVLTLFPEMFVPVVNGSILGRACSKGILDINLINIRDYSQNKHKKVDDYPFGGGVGMVMSAEPIFLALEDLNKDRGEDRLSKPGKLIYMSPRGKKLDEETVRELSKEEDITILCGHYEGVDERVLEYWDAEEISIGDYVLTGGELPAMVLIDTVARLVEGVLPNEVAAEEESIYSGLIEYPQYTKPREFRGIEVPEVLVSGNHKLIELWKFEKALEYTLERRPDLFEKYLETNKEELSKDKLKILKAVEEKQKKV